MEVNACNIQVLLQAAEYLERREREAEHGYASVLPFYSKGVTDKRKKQKSKGHSPGNSRSVHNELEKHRRAQLKHCLEQLKQQVPLSSDSARNTTLNLLRQAQLHIKKLQEQDERAELLKDRLRWEQRELRTRLEKLQGGSERMRNDSLGSAVSSERSDSEREDVEIDVESMVWTLESDGLGSSHAGVDHSYSTSDHAWL
ncbi:max dimerization 3 [Labeo rohita]|uniref:Max dimerization protein 3 n=2 Tax=Labeo rohita TaxID=84645 RepID=A0A498MVU5_LABRO|nr:max dimerization protein 3 [Labeo rohita]KAI2644330.1 Max dimerization protein 3 [Labeo rohita]RXN23742.1 max dimerization 3 [Labeo rohita]